MKNSIATSSRIVITTLAFFTLASAAHAQAATFQKNLYFGMVNQPDVMALQNILVAQGDYSGPISGNFYTLTAKAVKLFQAAHGLSPTGYVGPATRAALNSLQASGMTAAPIGWSAYGAVPTDFPKNPPAYIGTKVVIGGSVMDFLAEGDRGGMSNFIEMLAASADSSLNTQKFALEIDDSTNYALAVAGVDKPFSSSGRESGVIAYGTIMASQQFTNMIGGTMYVPVIKIDRLDMCGIITCPVAPGTSYTIKTLFPLMGISSTPAQVSSPNQTFTTPSGMIVNASGNVAGASNTTASTTPTQAQTSTLASWHLVTMFSGANNLATNAFNIRGTKWRINWTTTPRTGTDCSLYNCGMDVQITDSNSGTSIDQFSATPSTQLPASGTLFEYGKTGNFSLSVTAGRVSSWGLSVEDYY